MPLKEKSDVTHSSPRKARPDAAAGPQEQAAATVGGLQGAREGLGHSLSLDPHRRGPAGRGTSLGLAGRNGAAGLWGVKAVPCCLVPRPRLL